MVDMQTVLPTKHVLSVHANTIPAPLVECDAAFFSMIPRHSSLEPCSQGIVTVCWGKPHW